MSLAPTHVGYMPSNALRSDSPNLDFLRAVAVLCVFLRHLLVVIGIPPAWPMGEFGVLLFFVHTSLVLMMSLERIELSGRPLFRAFYIRRFFRIYPLSMACVGLVVLFRLPSTTYQKWFDPDLSTILANLFLCTNLFYKPNLIGVLWTLPLEVQMYILLPVFYLVGKRYRIRGVAVLWLVAVIAALVQPHVSGRLNIAIYVPCFLAGVASYFAGFGVVPRRFRFIGWPIAIVAAAGVFSYANNYGFRVVGSWLMCLMIGLTAPLFADLKWNPLRKSAAWIARYSYGIYLVHLYGLWAGIDLMNHQAWWIRCIVVLAISFGLPLLLYHLLESPMIKLGARLVGPRPFAASETTVAAPREVFSGRSA